MGKKKFTAEEIAALAKKADVDVRTLLDYLLGLPVRASSARRIEKVLK